MSRGEQNNLTASLTAGTHIQFVLHALFFHTAHSNPTEIRQSASEENECCYSSEKSTFRCCKKKGRNANVDMRNLLRLGLLSGLCSSSLGCTAGSHDSPLAEYGKKTLDCGARPSFEERPYSFDGSYHARFVAVLEYTPQQRGKAEPQNIYYCWNSAKLC